MEDYQFELRGVRFGPDTPFRLRRGAWGGLGSPAIRTDDVPLPRRGGAIGAFDESAPRVLTWEMFVRGSSPEDALAKGREAVAAFTRSSTDMELVARLPGWGDVRWVGRPRGCVMDVSRVALRQVELFATFVALDPLTYSAVEHSGSTGVGEVTGGLGFPHGFPHGFGFASPGTIEVHNAGSVAAPWTATLVGPLVSPRISTINGEGGDLDFAGFTLAAGQTLEIDSEARTVLLGGTASRYGALTTRRWFDLAPGTTTVHLGASAGEGTLTVRWRDAWL